MKPNVSNQDIDYPAFLTSITELKQHLDHRWQGISNKDKGDEFAKFVQNLIQRTLVGREFPLAENRGGSHDDGVDLLAERIDNDDSTNPARYLFVQSKYTINEKAQIDSIISKFYHFFQSQMGAAPQPRLFGGPELIHCHFMLVTSSKIDGVMAAYESSSMASKKFYSELKQNGLLSIVDIGDVLNILRDVYKKSVVVPPRIHLTFAQGPLEADDVFVGIISGRELVSLYQEHGDSLFYDNIREFLGLYSGRKQKKPQDGPTVNEEIVKTINEAPELFLQRNNGIVFRAKAVSHDPDGSWVLHEGNIINGCQTTMCLVQNLTGDCLVHAKIVKSSNSWDVAKAANYQTHISIIDLNLAQFLRPQIVAKVGSHFDTRLTERREGSAFALIDTVNAREIAYEEIKHLFIGIFSHNPNNIFNSNYTKLRTDLIDRFFVSEEDKDLVFESLFMLHEASLTASSVAAQTFTNPQYASLLQRFYRTTKTDYHAYLTLLATSAAIGRSPILRDDETTAENTNQDFASLRAFVSEARALIENERDQFQRYFMHAFKALAHKSISAGDPKSDGDSRISEQMILKNMHSDITGQSFPGLLREVSLYADDDPQITRKPHQRQARADVPRQNPRRHR